MGQVVSLSNLGDGIIQITMEDRSSRNTFSPQIIEGLTKAFEQVQNNKENKVVILTGYENYFSCGGTREELISIQKGEIGFNDLDFFLLPLLCELPVIAAMQGHAIGGGFVLGLYCDFCILARESIYTTNFMKYGFTPGMGATLMVPLRVGPVLGHEMLFSAESFHGAELKERGLPYNVVPRNRVVDEAIRLAKSLAEKPRVSLTALKHHLNTGIRQQLDAVIARELEMHGITFHQPEVARRIDKFFGQ